jgi:drug/metabolite transporter (DMT)-like permease
MKNASMNNSTTQTSIKTWGLLVLLALIWGSSFFLTKRSLGTFSVIEVAAGRLFFAAVFFAPIVWRTHKQIPKHLYKYIFISALAGYIVPAFLFSLAGAHLNSSLSGMLNSSSPLFTLVLGALFFGQITTKNQVWGILIGLLGAVLLVLAQQKSGNITLADPYALLPLIGTVLYGLNTNIIAKYTSHLPALAMAAFTFVFIGAISFVTLLTTDFFTKIIQPQHIGSTLYLLSLGLLSSAFASVLFNRLVQLSSGLFASSVTYLIPIVAVVWGLFDHENILPQQYVGMGVILAGIYLVNKK